MADWDFTVDSERQDELSTRLNESAEKFDSGVDNLYSKIDTLGTSWVGSDYDSFKTGTLGYQEALHDLADSFRMYANHFDSVSEGTSELATQVVNLINSCTLGKDGALGGVEPGPGGTYQSNGNNYSNNSNGQGGETVSDQNGGYGSGNGEYQHNEYDSSQNGYGNGSYGGGHYDENGNYVQDPTVTASDPNAGGEQEKQGYWSYQGQRYVDDWHDFTRDVVETWNNVDNPITGIWAIADTALEFGLFVADETLNVAETAVDSVNYCSNWLFDLGTGRGGSDSGEYWSNIGQDYAENWDYSNVDGLGSFLWATGSGVVRTGVDAVQTTINAADTAIDFVCDTTSDVVDWCGDRLSDLGDWLFG